ncbi:hypothetical protein [Umezakia ovalisporum]|uniref:Methyltransferase n=1 Tax=Umezakia ovalisporum FSS-62 TaxID=2971776 RepID=A0AA43H063_9CYAN|nr:hypothetical protein [Umezakia ovalisporum]MDH6064658.1 hypothetical protein [Umezakia ovalisporum FSS-62]
MSNQQEYYYPNTETGHHHKYLINPLLKMISSASHPLKNQPKPRLLDIGCGNGSFRNVECRYKTLHSYI